MTWILKASFAYFFLFFTVPAGIQLALLATGAPDPQQQCRPGLAVWDKDVREYVPCEYWDQFAEEWDRRQEPAGNMSLRAAELIPMPKAGQKNRASTYAEALLN